MATWKFEGNDRYIEYLHKLDADADEIIKKAVYKGAGVVADAVKSSINGLTVDDNTNKDVRSGPTSEEKEGLVSGFGISKMKDEDGYINVKLGFAGRNSRKTKKNPNGQANIIVARNLESGTSWLAKTPFVRTAVNSKKDKCEEIMAKTFDEEIKKLTP